MKLLLCLRVFFKIFLVCSAPPQQPKPKNVTLLFWECAIFENVWGGVSLYSYAISICIVPVRTPAMIQDSCHARHRMKTHSQPQSARYCIDFAVSLYWISFYYYFCIFLLFLLLFWLLNMGGLIIFLSKNSWALIPCVIFTQCRQSYWLTCT